VLAPGHENSALGAGGVVPVCRGYSHTCGQSRAGPWDMSMLLSQVSEPPRDMTTSYTTITEIHTCMEHGKDRRTVKGKGVPAPYLSLFPGGEPVVSGAFLWSPPLCISVMWAAQRSLG
jgi:hypothetical protein